VWDFHVRLDLIQSMLECRVFFFWVGFWKGESQGNDGMFLQRRSGGAVKLKWAGSVGAEWLTRLL
jgi:hypothetical protein